MLEAITFIDPTEYIMESPVASVPRIVATFEALELLDVIRAAHGQVVFHQSGGCCDGSQPMCFPAEEFRMGTQDVCLGQVDGVGFWMHAEQFAYWENCQLTLDVVEGRGSSFSLEIPYGKRFHIRSRLFTDQERDNLVSVVRIED